LVGIERDRGEDPVLGEEVVADRHLVEEILLEQLLLLPEAAEQEEELGLEGELVAVLVEAGEEGVLLDDLEDAAPAEALRQRAGERRLAHPDGTFDYDVPVPQRLHAGAEISTEPAGLQH